jgi:hypothetical protein
MRKKTRSVLEEIDSILPDRDKSHVIESRANHIISSAINLINLMYESFDEDVAKDLEKRFLNSVRTQDGKKFVRGIRKIDEKKDFL